VNPKAGNPAPNGQERDNPKMKNPHPCGRGQFGGAILAKVRPPAFANGLQTAFTLKFLPGEFPRAAHGFGLFAGFLDGRFLEMLLELHFTKYAFALQLLLQSAQSLFDVVIADADLHVVVTTFLS
jgi:hypothetical protein